jgi:hypothetical protein
LTNNGETVQVSDSSYGKLMNLFLMFLSFYAENRRYYFTGNTCRVAAVNGRHIGGILEGQNYLEYR